jgi:RHS repeat-associated protein
VQRLVRLRVLGAGGGAIVDREYGYNRASQRTSEKRNDDLGLTDRYSYDSAYRITASSFDQDGLPGAVARSLTNVSYVMDGVGNRRDVAKRTSVGLTAEGYSVNAVNEYVTVAGVARTHDDNGNLLDDGSKLLSFDYKNRLVGVLRKADLRPVALYGYLPDGRRSRKQFWNPDTNHLLSDTRYVSDGAQEVEEQDWSTGVTTCTYVWSPVYVDELVSFTNGSGTYYAHQDARCDVVALTNASGAIVERRRYDDFGKEEIWSPLGAVVAVSPSQCEYGFQGRRLDPETGLVFFRARHYSTETGRFVERDASWDAGNVGGQYSFCGNGPSTRRDPAGARREFDPSDDRVFRELMRDAEIAGMVAQLKRDGWTFWIGDAGGNGGVTQRGTKTIEIRPVPPGQPNQGMNPSFMQGSFIHELYHATTPLPTTMRVRADAQGRVSEQDWLDAFSAIAEDDEIQAYRRTHEALARLKEAGIVCDYPDPIAHIYAVDDKGVPVVAPGNRERAIRDWVRGTSPANDGNTYHMIHERDGRRDYWRRVDAHSIVPVPGQTRPSTPGPAQGPEVPQGPRR